MEYSGRLHILVQILEIPSYIISKRHTFITWMMDEDDLHEPESILVSVMAWWFKIALASDSSHAAAHCHNASAAFFSSRTTAPPTPCVVFFDRRHFVGAQYASWDPYCFQARDRKRGRQLWHEARTWGTIGNCAKDEGGIGESCPDRWTTKSTTSHAVFISLVQTLIKASTKAINALFLLKSATPPSLLDEPLGYSPTARPSDLYDVPQSTVLHRGQSFFDKVYGKVSKRVMSQMDRSGTEDLGITARLMYGYILSNTNVLSARETSFVLVAGLIPQDVKWHPYFNASIHWLSDKVPAQLKGHIKGCLNHGASVEEVKAVREVVIKICEASGMRQLDGTIPGGWGWRGPVANLWYDHNFESMHSLIAITLISIWSATGTSYILYEEMDFRAELYGVCILRRLQWALS